jgi:hypothetical protein
MTFSIMQKIAMLSVAYVQCHLCSVSLMLSVIYAECYVQALYDECHYAVCHYAEYLGACKGATALSQLATSATF